MNWKSLLNPMRAKNLLGMSHKTAKPISDSRSEFDRDYGRAVFSTPVRRLQDKAQVFPFEPHDSVRTRLTHSLEVSTLCRSLVRRLSPFLETQGVDRAELEAIEVIATTCGLLHDIGNPPFGHSGEYSIQSWFANTASSSPLLASALGGQESQLYQDFAAFEGNAQTLRLVTCLQMLADRYGLNLTVGTLSALTKYLAPSHLIDTTRHTHSKPGFFASEADLIAKVREAAATHDSRNPITFLVEAADDMVYSTVDLEDAVKKGILEWSDFVDIVKPADQDLVERCESYVATSPDLVGERTKDEAYAQVFRTFAMYQHVEAAALEFQANYDAIMAGGYSNELLSVGKSSGLLSACKLLARQKVYVHSDVLKRELVGRSVIHGLLDAFWEGARQSPGAKLRTFAGKLYYLLSANYRQIFEWNLELRKDLPREYQQLQLVTDYVCGMTDSFAIALHRELGLS